MSLDLKPHKFWMREDSKKIPLGMDKPIDLVDMNEEQKRMYGATDALFKRIQSNGTVVSLEDVVKRVQGFNNICEARSSQTVDNWHTNGRQLGDNFSVVLSCDDKAKTPTVMTYRLLSDTRGDNFYLEMVVPNV